MSTRAQVRFATREDGVSFSEHPNAIHAQFYKHHDGYPEGLGLDLATTLLGGNSSTAVPLEIDSLDTRRGDIEYIYYIWQAPKRPTYISIFEVGYDESKCNTCGQKVISEDKCIFVGSPLQLINELEENK